ncbi:odorant receptor 22c-like [Odontomachus brunneus]|uniref:odorant receptor 22c-like n=1 Tax=Odontomachus brunneus TaxID=486640 RepID=UPI0013F24B32|nr:odorant receptor 22c-like [Odontomachus brunneus]
MTITRMTTVSTSVEMGLRFIGIWPGSAYGNFQWFVYMTSVVIVMYFQYAFIVKNFDRNHLSVLIDALSMTMAYSLAFLKLVSLWLNRRLFYEILATMDEDWKEYITADSRMYPMIIYANLSRRCSNILMSINASAAVFYVLGGVVRGSAKDEDDPRETKFDLPVKMEFPFEVNESPIFEITAVAQFLHELSLSSLVAMINSLVVTLILHVSGQIDIMRQGLMKISSESYQNTSFPPEIKVLILKHQRIITLSDNIDGLFSWIALMQFLSNTLVICCLGFMIIITIGNKQGAVVLTKSILFYVAITLEAFVFCFAGEYLSAKSKSIGDAVYESVWYDMTPNQCRTLLLVIVRSQKRLTITAGKVMDLSLEGFTSVRPILIRV